MSYSQCPFTYDILIPIYNAYECLERCLSSLIRFTDSAHRVFLLDDHSTDPRVVPLLEEVANTDHRFVIMKSEKQVGYVRNVNRALDLSKNRVVLLNSDTELTSHWLERLDRCLNSCEKIGIATPLSNYASILSVPVMNVCNRLPSGFTPDHFGRVVAEQSDRSYPRIPTAIGFCMAMKREVIDELGPFSLAFSPGYFEECDYSMRAWEKGIEIACCDDAFVYHCGSASFGGGNRMVARKDMHLYIHCLFWPDYPERVRAFETLDPLRPLRARVRKALPPPPDARILQVVHHMAGLGGVQLHVSKLVKALEKDFQFTLSYPKDEKTGRAYLHQPPLLAGSTPVIELCRNKERFQEFLVGFPADNENKEVEDLFAKILQLDSFDAVHFHHLAGWGSLQLPAIAKKMGKKVIVSLHDYFLLCPQYNLLLPDNTPCSKKNASPDACCSQCLHLKWRQADVERYIRERHALAKQLLHAADALVAPSEHVRNLYGSTIGDDMGERIKVISMGTVRKNLLNTPVRSIDQEAQCYQELYRKVLGL
ncbi:MAG: glycosyltransferase [Deltaproteobacteria bacterium]|nr:glycosyltransferase [Deltaproteobacteria bacterium]